MDYGPYRVARVKFGGGGGEGKHPYTNGFNTSGGAVRSAPIHSVAPVSRADGGGLLLGSLAGAYHWAGARLFTPRVKASTRLF